MLVRFVRRSPRTEPGLAVAGLLAGLAVGLAGGCGAAVPEDLPPNVILVSLDTLRPDHLSAYGYERATTPFLDEFGDESVRYTRAYATASWTLISHMSMLTGTYPRRHGVEKETALSPEIPLLAERLKDAGYHTIGIYFDGWIAPRFGFDRGFDVFKPRQSARAASNALAQALDERPRNRPLFLFLHLFDAHCGTLTDEGSTIYDAPPEYANMFRDGAAERIRALPVYDVYYGKRRVTPEEGEDIIALYDGGVRELDDYMRGWVADWRERGILDEALLIVTSDHGEALGNRGRWSGHGDMHDVGLRVPLIVRYPDGRGAGTVDDRVTSSVDLVPTVLDVLQLGAEPWLGGRSLLAEPRGADDVVLAERDEHRVVMNGRFKMIRTDPGLNIQLFDLENDPRERIKLKREEGEDAHSRLMGALRKLDLRTSATPGAPIPIGGASDEDQAALDAIGYAE